MDCARQFGLRWKVRNMFGMASLDLSAAFDISNTELLLKRLKTIGIQDDKIR